MNTSFRKSFTRDLEKVKEPALRERVRAAIEQVETAAALYYRIRVGEYRIGVTVEGDTVEFVRCLPRRDLYRFFP